MNILAIETSSKVAGVAVVKNAILAQETYLDVGLTHSQTIMPMVEKSLLDAQIDIGEIDAFAIDVGPGSFTGIRIGVASANAMAQASGKKIIEVNAFETIAANVPLFFGDICVMIDARQNRIYGAVYAFQGDEIVQKSDFFAGSIQDFLQNKIDIKNEKTIFIGDGAISQKQEILSVFGEKKAAFLPPRFNKQSAAAVAIIAQKKFVAKNFVLQAQPMYLKMPEIC